MRPKNHTSKSVGLSANSGDGSGILSRRLKTGLIFPLEYVPDGVRILATRFGGQPYELGTRFDFLEGHFTEDKPSDRLKSYIDRYFDPVGSLTSISPNEINANFAGVISDYISETIAKKNRWLNFISQYPEYVKLRLLRGNSDLSDVLSGEYLKQEKFLRGELEENQVYIDLNDVNELSKPYYLGRKTPENCIDFLKNHYADEIAQGSVSLTQMRRLDHRLWQSLRKWAYRTGSDIETVIPKGEPKLGRPMVDDGIDPNTLDPSDPRDRALLAVMRNRNNARETMRRRRAGKAPSP